MIEVEKQREKDEERPGGQWVKMATSTMNGMYVIRETPAMMRQRNRHVRASVGDGRKRSALNEQWKMHRRG